jgi:hypothetical protein
MSSYVDRATKKDTPKKQCTIIGNGHEHRGKYRSFPKDNEGEKHLEGVTQHFHTTPVLGGLHPTIVHLPLAW